MEFNDFLNRDRPIDRMQKNITSMCGDVYAVAVYEAHL